MTRPVMHVIAGPNGAGKSTLYNTRIKPREPGAAFVNADVLAQAHFGHPAASIAESEMGQRLAEEMRAALIAARRDLVFETTFSHVSKLKVLRDAQSAGYEIRVYHVNLRNADLAVKRVARRVSEGGHEVPEDKTRGRYERNQPLIREAAWLADRAWIFDNSEFGRRHTRVLEFAHGKAVFVGPSVPVWARELYSEQLRAYAPERVNRAAASFVAAEKLTRDVLGDAVRLRIARYKLDDASYDGTIVCETDLHVVQRISSGTAIAHLRPVLSPVPAVGDNVVITYSSQRGAVRAKAGTVVTASQAVGDASTGPIVRIEGVMFVQSLADGREIAHDRSKLYKQGGGLDALLRSGGVVTITYGKSGAGWVESVGPRLRPPRGRGPRR